MQLTPNPIPMVLHCPQCGKQHVDEGEWETRQHRSHLCAECGTIWRPCAFNTVGVRRLSGLGAMGQRDTWPDAVIKN